MKRRPSITEVIDAVCALDGITQTTIVEASHRAERLIQSDARFARLFDDCHRRLHRTDPWSLLSNDEAMAQDPQRFRAEVAAEAFTATRSP